MENGNDNINNIGNGDTDLGQFFYKNCLNNIRKYISLLNVNEGEYALSTNDDEEILAILNDLVDCGEDDEELLDLLLDRSRPDIKVSDISEVQSNQLIAISDRWHPFALSLFRMNRVEPTFSNVEAYVNEFGSEGLNAEGGADSEDSPLSILRAFLEKQTSLTNCQNIPFERRETLSEKLINFDFLFSNKLAILKSIIYEKKEFLDPAVIDIKLVRPKDYATLLKSGLIPDNWKSWKKIKDLTWERKKDYITVSKQFVDYVDDSLNPDDACRIIQEKIGSNKLRELIWNNPDKYLFSAEQELLVKTCIVAVQDYKMTPFDFTKLKRAHKLVSKDKPFSQLLELSLPDLTIESIMMLLSTMQDPGFEKMTTNDRRTTVFHIANTNSNEAILQRFANKELLKITERNSKSIHAKRINLQEWPQLDKI